MPIVKAKNFVEVYRARAMAADIHELAGRRDQKHLTRFVTSEIIKGLEIQSGDTALDIGCGDGTLLREVSGFVSKGIGIVPTPEERDRLVKEHRDLRNVEFITALAQFLPLEAGLADKIVCNSVFLIFESDEAAFQALREIHRTAKSGALIWLGEILAVDEMAARGKTYGDSIALWLLYVLRHSGLKAFLDALNSVLKAAFTDEPFIISPKRNFVAPPDKFIPMAQSCGLELVSWRKHKEIDLAGTITESETRNDFIFRKP